jgi:hypothetical protein
MLPFPGQQCGLRKMPDADHVAPASSRMSSSIIATSMLVFNRQDGSAAQEVLTSHPISFAFGNQRRRYRNVDLKDYAVCMEVDARLTRQFMRKAALDQAKSKTAAHRLRTAGPPRSTHLNRRTSPGISFHERSTLPPSVLSAPYFTAFVASSCNPNAIASADWGLSIDLVSADEEPARLIFGRTEGSERPLGQLPQRRADPVSFGQQVVRARKPSGVT